MGDDSSLGYCHIEEANVSYRRAEDRSSSISVESRREYYIDAARKYLLGGDTIINTTTKMTVAYLSAMCMNKANSFESYNSNSVMAECIDTNKAAATNDCNNNTVTTTIIKSCNGRISLDSSNTTINDISELPGVTYSSDDAVTDLVFMEQKLGEIGYIKPVSLSKTHSNSNHSNNQTVKSPFTPNRVRTNSDSDGSSDAGSEPPSPYSNSSSPAYGSKSRDVQRNYWSKSILSGWTAASPNRQQLFYQPHYLPSPGGGSVDLGSHDSSVFGSGLSMINAIDTKKEVTVNRNYPNCDPNLVSIEVLSELDFTSPKAIVDLLLMVKRLSTENTHMQCRIESLEMREAAYHAGCKQMEAFKIEYADKLRKIKKVLTTEYSIKHPRADNPVNYHVASTAQIDKDSDNCTARGGQSTNGNYTVELNEAKHRQKQLEKMVKALLARIEQSKSDLDHRDKLIIKYEKALNNANHHTASLAGISTNIPTASLSTGTTNHSVTSPGGGFAVKSSRSPATATLENSLKRMFK